MSRKNPETPLQQLTKELVSTAQYNCATTCLRALLPHQPSPESIEAIFDNVLTLEEIALMIILEHLEKGQPAIHRPLDENSPSSFFNHFARQCDQSGPAYDFVGGFILSKKYGQDRDGGRNRTLLHIITVTKIHRTNGGAKASIIDTSSLKMGSRDIPLGRLDELIMPPDHPYLIGKPNLVRALALCRSRPPLSEKFCNLLPTLRDKREELRHRAQGYHQEEEYWGTFLRRN